MEKPQICSVCTHATFLRCINCSTVYCSTVCQVKDWEKHKSKCHEIKNKFDQKKPPPIKPRSVQSLKANQKFTISTKQSRPSVQDRLSKAASKDNSRDKEKIENALEKSKADSETNLSKSSENPVTISGNTTANDFTSIDSENEDNEEASVVASEADDSKFLKSYVYKEKVALGPGSALEGDGFFYVKITHVHVDNTAIFHYVTPYEFIKGAKIFSKKLQASYADSRGRFLTADDIEVDQLVIMKINGILARCVILKYIKSEGLIAAQNIDTGYHYITKIHQAVIKRAGFAEMDTKAFCFKVFLDNIEDPMNVNVGDFIAIKIDEDKGSYFKVTVQPKDDDESDCGTIDELNVTLDVSKHDNTIEEVIASKTPDVLLIDNLMKVELKQGSYKLDLLDVVFEENKIQVCENSNENKEFYKQMAKDIEIFINDHPNDNNFIPMKGELVLALYTDGAYYRAECIEEVKDNKCKLHFIDYGSRCVVSCKDIWKMPKELFTKVICSPATLKLKSGKSVPNFKDIDIMSQLGETPFFGTVAKVNGLYTVTIEDFLIEY